nr:Rep [Kummerowia striata CRESS virus]
MTPEKQPKSSRYWCLTYNNPEEDIDIFNQYLNKLIDTKKLQYVVYQLEKGLEETSHYQIYIELFRDKPFTYVKGIFPKCHIEPRKGTGTQARDYCMKEESRQSGPYEFGEFKNISQGKRTDLSKVADLVKSGTSLKRIANEYPEQFMKYHNGIQKLMKLNDPPFQHEYTMDQYAVQPLTDFSKSILLVGPTNNGKTHYACAHFKNPLLVSQMDDLQRLSEDHDGIVFDDQSYNHMPPNTVIHLLDMEFTRSIRNRHYDAVIPKKTPKIFTNNRDDIFKFEGTDPEVQKAIERRYVTIYINEPLF